MSELFDQTYVLAFITGMAALLSLITEMTKELPKLRDIPTALQVIVMAVILVPVAAIALAGQLGYAVTWQYVFAAFLAAFVVAYVSMYGWEKMAEIIRKTRKEQ